METYFNTKELSGYLKIPEQSIRRWVLNNKIPYHRIHGVIRYRMSEIDKWVGKQKETVPADLDSKQEKDLFNEMDETEAVEIEEESKKDEAADSGENE